MTCLRTGSLFGAAMVSLLAAFPTYSQTPNQGQQSLIIVDANKKKVGDVVGFTTDETHGNGLARVPVVHMKIGGYSLTPGVLRDEFVNGPGGKGVVIYYAYDDCSGQAYHVNPGVDQRPTPMNLHQVFGSILFVQDGEPTVVELRSLKAWPDQCLAGPDYNFPALTDVIPIRPLIDLGAHFTPPFTVR